MSTNWKAGDKALRVEPVKRVDGRFHSHNGIVTSGTIYLVEMANEMQMANGPELRLMISGYPNIWTPDGVDYGWSASRFRKIVPACDRATNQEEGLVPHEGFWEGRQ